MDQEFTVLENKNIGRNIYRFRKLKEKKASELADCCGLSEQAFTKYERGETKITIDFIQKVAECLEVDPLQLIATSAGHSIENGHNSPIAINGINQTINEEHLKMINKLMESQLALMDKLLRLLDSKL